MRKRQPSNNMADGRRMPDEPMRDASLGRLLGIAVILVAGMGGSRIWVLCHM